MIQIAGVPFQQSDMWPVESTGKMIVQLMNESPLLYAYQSVNELSFELVLRESIMTSAQLMNQGDAEFATFETSRCNPQYWQLTMFGGFQLKPNVRPADAINDIFLNSSLYAFECAGAMLITYYHAVLQNIGESSFNQLFSNLFIYSWHSDPDLGIHLSFSNNFLPGDVIYFKNPDFDPQASQWRGENAVVLGNGLYFGHGLGILTSEGIIESLNSVRKPGATRSAYLTDTIARPSFKRLQRVSMQRDYVLNKIQFVIITHNESSISYDRYKRFLDQIYRGV
ncbi:protein-glutamine gamma-glutamyltransferase [Virgibacillus byunsanensis]|uniref:Protein-glutamine gamma-glutamyltransferase n=1 Tax=Virgibacillus byunsanensis TaxID=570945 RepID=A0ABW3LQ14_9BACI